MRPVTDRLVIRGARGTACAYGPDYLQVGGDTTCFSVLTAKGVLVVDAGTGISHLARELAESSALPSITVIFTHLHLDHLIGLPSFGPLYSRNATVTFMADPRREENWKNALRAFVHKPYWPIGLGDSEALMRFEDLPVKRGLAEICGLPVRWFRATHPQQCLAYRLELRGGPVVIATDVEYDVSTLDPRFVEFCGEARHLLYDAHYTPDEYANHRGWGHSTWETATDLARRAGVGQLVLTHHAPTRTDKEVSAIVAAAGTRFPRTIAAHTNLVLD